MTMSRDEFVKFEKGLPEIEGFDPPFEDRVTIENIAEIEEIFGVEYQVIRHKISGPGKYGEVSWMALVTTKGYSDNPNVRFIGKHAGFGDLSRFFFVYENNKIKSAYYELLIRVRSFVGTINNRILLTLGIWGLAERTLGAYPQWSDVKIIDRIVKWLDQRK